MSLHKLTVLPAKRSFDSQVFLDGELVKGVRSLQLDLNASSIPSIVMNMVLTIDRIEVENGGLKINGITLSDDEAEMIYETLGEYLEGKRS